MYTNKCKIRKQEASKSGDHKFDFSSSNLPKAGNTSTSFTNLLKLGIKLERRGGSDKTDFVTKQCKLRQKQFYNNTVGTEGGSEPEAQVMTEIEQNVFNIKDL